MADKINKIKKHIFDVGGKDLKINYKNQREVETLINKIKDKKIRIEFEFQKDEQKFETLYDVSSNHDFKLENLDERILAKKSEINQLKSEYETMIELEKAQKPNEMLIENKKKELDSKKLEIAELQKKNQNLKLLSEDLSARLSLYELNLAKQLNELINISKKLIDKNKKFNVNYADNLCAEKLLILEKIFVEKLNEILNKKD